MGNRNRTKPDQETPIETPVEENQAPVVDTPTDVESQTGETPEEEVADTPVEGVEEGTTEEQSGEQDTTQDTPPVVDGANEAIAETEKVSDEQLLVIDMMSTYLTKMDPKYPHDGLQSIVAQQRSLNRLLKMVLKYPESDRQKAVAYIVDTIRNNRKTVFHEMYYARGFNDKRLFDQEKDRNAALDLLTLFIGAADSKSGNKPSDVGISVEKVVKSLPEDLKAPVLETFK